MAIAVNLTKTKLLTSAAAAVLAMPLWAGAALAQENQAQTQGTDQTQQTDQAQGQGSDQAQQTQQQGQAGQQAQGQGNASDALLATVGDAEIRNSDLMRAIGALPPQLSAQPPELAAATAFQQLLLREAILQQARSQGLAQDPQVQSLVEGATQAAEEDALVQVWLQRELQNRVTTEAVDAAYSGLQAVAGDQPVPPLEQIRPQIQQSLAQQAMSEIQSSLLSNAQVTLFGPDGQPVNQQGSGDGQGGNSGNGGQSSDGSDSSEQSSGGNN